MIPTILIILLGCNVFDILQDRMDTTFAFIREMNESQNVHMFLSGGVKYGGIGESEASKMKTIVKKFSENIKIQFVLDEKSVNTAENFIRASHFLNTTEQMYTEVYVVTSKFHYKRAKQMLELIDSSREFLWILGEKELHDSLYWENIHIKNVGADVEKAKNILL